MATPSCWPARLVQRSRRVRKRPLSITLIGWIFVAAGLIGLAYHASEFKAERPFDSDFLWVCLVRLLAMGCGAFVLRGSNWARWLLVVWLGYHVGLSVIHTPFELAVHSLLFAGFLFFYFVGRHRRILEAQSRMTPRLPKITDVTGHLKTSHWGSIQNQPP